MEWWLRPGRLGRTFRDRNAGRWGPRFFIGFCSQLQVWRDGWRLLLRWLSLEVMSMPSDKHYTLTRHREWREKVLRQAGYQCQECKRYGKTTAATHAHHIKPRSDYPELQYVVNNGMALCTSCHNKLEPRGYPPTYRN